MTPFSTRRRVALAAALAALSAVPSGAAAQQAPAVSVTGDDGNPVSLAGGPTIRNMSPRVAITLPTDQNTYYSASFTGPDGAATSTPITCFSIPVSRAQDYRGNGAYKVAIQQYSDRNCSQTAGAAVVHGYTIAAGVSLTGLAGKHLIRSANSFVTNPVSLPFGPNPGALGNEVRYALNGAVGPDGALTGASQEAFVDSSGVVGLRLQTPGRYVVVARAKGFTPASGQQFFTPWTAPVVVDAIAPFDIETTRTPDSRGPSYKILVTLREKSTRGKVKLAYARGKKGGRYRSMGSATISSKGTFTKRFTLKRAGTYRIRVSYPGSPTVAKGTALLSFRISRTFSFAR